MPELLANALTVFFGFFAIMNPIANTPVFLGLVGDADKETRKAIARKSLFIAFVVICCFCLLGQTIFNMFGISLPAFRIAGGILVALVGYQMLHGESSKVQQPTSLDQVQAQEARMSVAISPLAVPILAGPGTIATALNFSANANVLSSVLVALIFGVLCLVTYGFFLAGEKLPKLIGRNGINVFTRLMGMILTVIGVQMLLEGVQSLNLSA